jgi:hypothetical protein
MGMRGRASNIFSLENLAQLTLFFVGGMVILSLAAPELLPQLERGPSCDKLPHPPGGNQRSLLAINDENQSLEVDVNIANATTEGGSSVEAGDPLELRVVLRNADTSPIYLFYNEDFPPPIGATSAIEGRGVIGLYLQITAATNSTLTFTDNTPNNQGYTANQLAGGSFDLQSVYVLQAKRSCNISVTITPEQLQSMGLGPGDYRVQAFYRNTTAGNLVHAPGATATPLFDESQRVEYGQGIWTGQAASDEVRFSIVQPTP